MTIPPPLSASLTIIDLLLANVRSAFRCSNDTLCLIDLGSFDALEQRIFVVDI